MLPVKMLSHDETFAQIYFRWNDRGADRDTRNTFNGELPMDPRGTEFSGLFLLYEGGF